MTENIVHTNQKMVTIRSIQRQSHQAKVNIFEPSTLKNTYGKLYNYSQCRLYVETETFIEPGTIVCITEDDILANYLFPSPAGYNTASVRWYQKLQKEEAGYKIGLKLCMTECDACESMIPVDQVITFPGTLNLCPGCADIAQSMPEGRLKACLTQFLTGNVI